MEAERLSWHTQVDAYAYEATPLGDYDLQHYPACYFLSFTFKYCFTDINASKNYGF